MAATGTGASDSIARFSAGKFRTSSRIGGNAASSRVTVPGGSILRSGSSIRIFITGRRA